ncbi:MAG: hypothetical protein NTV86_06630 [Planctomycetota bacterium]|nr:hypothetical protein [Planctomycetota bacterium]
MTPLRQPAASPGPWGPLGALYLAFLLAGLAAGLWHEALYPPRFGRRPVTLPTLQTLALAQAAFAMLVYPLAALWRSQRQTPASGRYWSGALAETAVFFAVAAPFYYVAAFLADAVFADVFRLAIYQLCLWAFVLAAGAVLQNRPAWRPAVLLLLVFLALGTPLLCYAAIEFIAPADPGVTDFMSPPPRLVWLWHLSPALNSWLQAASRCGAHWPEPLWPCLLLLVAGGALFALSPGQGKTPGGDTKQ